MADTRIPAATKAAVCVAATAHLWRTMGSARPPRLRALAPAWALYGASVAWCFHGLKW